MHKIFGLVSALLERLTGKRFLYITPNAHNAHGRTAIQDRNGVWYTGNVFDKTDVAYGVAQRGVVEPSETELVNLVLNELKKTKEEPLVFFDIGANIGYYGIFVATIHNALVHAFEPLPEYIACIKKAAILNHVQDRVTIHSIAVSDHEAMESFVQSGSGSSLEPGFNANENWPVTQVPTMSIATLISNGTIPTSPDFIKIDVEGHEYAVLSGGASMISSQKPVLFIELCTTLKNIGRTYVNPYYGDTLRFLEESNYDVFCVRDEHTLETWGEAKKIDNAGMFLCLHTENHKKIFEEIKRVYTIL